MLLEKEELSLEGSVEESLIQFVLTFDSSFFKGKKTLFHDDPLCCFLCFFIGLSLEEIDSSFLKGS